MQDSRFQGDDAPAALRQHFQPYVDAVWALLKERNLSPMSFSELLYGRDPVKNTVRGTGHVYGLIGGKTRPGQSLIVRIKEKTGVDLAAIAPLPYSPLPKNNKKKKKKKPTNVREAHQAAMQLTPIRAVVEAHKVATQSPTILPLPPPPARRASPPVVGLQIDQDGSANLTLNLVGVTAEEALRVMAILTSHNIIKAKGDAD